MTSYAITDSDPTGDVTYTIGGGSNMHTAKISPSNTFTMLTIGNLISKLKDEDEVYVTNLASGDFSALINDLMVYDHGDIAISLYVQGCPDTDISFDETISKLSTLLFDGGAIKTISTTVYQNFLLIVNGSETLTSVSFKGDKLDLSGCPNVTLSTTSLNWVILKLNGCSNIELEEVDLDINTTDVDFTDMGSITTLNCSNCKITAIDLSNTRISSINISDSIITTIKIPKKIDSLTISNLINEISIDSTKQLYVQKCNVSCENVNLESNGSAISFNNSGTISNVNAEKLSNIYIKLENCENLSIIKCTNVNCGGDIFTNATNSLTIKDTTFNTLSMDFESNKVEVSNISAAGNTLNIRNYNGKTEDLKIDDNISFNSCSIWSCPEIVPSNIKSDTIYLIDSPITEIPSEWANDSIYLYSCHNIESISGTYATLIVINCSKLKEVDVSNIDLYRFIWNQSLDTIIKDGDIYGNSGELIDNLSTSPAGLYGNILRFNAFENLKIYSAPNIINGKLIYNKQYNIVANTNTEVENSIGSNVNDENMNYTGLCVLGQDVTSDYSAGLGPYFIWTDFTNINTSPFTDPIDICGYNMNTDVKNGLIDMMNSYTSIYPETIITDIPSSSFNNKNILVLSTSDLKPSSSDAPNKFNIYLVV